MAVGRVLWARRWLLAAGFAVAVLAGVMMVYSVKPGLPPKLQSKQHYVGQGAAQVLIDTPSSQLAGLGSPNDPATTDPNLYSQATLLADVMATGPEQTAIADRLGIPAAALVVKPPSDSVAVPIRATPLALAGKKLETAGKWTLAVTIDPALPIIAFSTLAPTPQGAEKLAAAAVAVLGQRLDAVAAAQRIPAGRRLVVNVIDPPGAAPLAVGPRKLYGMGVAIVLFLAICFTVVVVSGRRRRRAQERLAGDEPHDLAASSLSMGSPATATTSMRAVHRSWRHSRSGSATKSETPRRAKGARQTTGRASE
jgi:hypothetical protein